ncbi:MAG: hypothetical protein OXC69_04955 [Candidatus Tectomicrobia bacterium]|nr:hypothetical protein [Candidatus Tectomicrobia bacterium]
MPKPIGRILNIEWNVGAKHALYREDGKWYHHLERFPGALFDFNGYVVFGSKEEYETCGHLEHGTRLNVKDEGISCIPGYVRKRQPPEPRTT